MRRLTRFICAGTALCLACVGDDPSPAGGGGNDGGVGDGTAPPPVNPQPPPTDGGNDADDGGGPWTPAKIDAAQNLALWLEAKASTVTISNGGVGEWRDQSAHAHKALAVTGPTVDAAVIAGHDAYHFTTQTMVLTIKDSTSLQFGTEQFYMTAVAKVVPTAPGLGYFFSKVTTKNAGAGDEYDHGIEFFATHNG